MPTVHLYDEVNEPPEGCEWPVNVEGDRCGKKPARNRFHPYWICDDCQQRHRVTGWFPPLVWYKVKSK